MNQYVVIWKCDDVGSISHSHTLQVKPQGRIRFAQYNSKLKHTQPSIESKMLENDVVVYLYSDNDIIEIYNEEEFNAKFKKDDSYVYNWS